MPPDELDALLEVLSLREVRAARVVAGIIIGHGTSAERQTAGRASAVAMGADGGALADGIALLGQTLAELLKGET